MDDYSIKVLSWLGISMVTTYRILWVKLYTSIREEEDKRNENIKILTKLITNDTKELLQWMKEDQLINTCKKEETISFPESVKFQTLSIKTNSSLFTCRIIVLQNPMTDKDTFMKWVRTRENMLTVCTEDEKETLTELISVNHQKISKLILKDTTKFIDIIKGLKDTLDEKTKHDIKTLIETKWLSPSNTYRYYDLIVLSKTSNKETMTDLGERALCEPGCPSALNITLTKVELKWEEPIIGTDFIHFYQIFCEEQSSSRRWFFETPRNDCNFVVEELKPNTKYAFKIQAVKNGQNKGPISKTLTVSTLEISCDRMAEFSYILFYIAVLIWFTYLLCYSLTAT
ncbi:uncharacterized protein LOC134701619 [Mytilus trossulus]|uniref:uncharacterized protein LOC134701619 n=1 Tax=Mytilus trossulus TaxID=6551 RepID=UPI0030059C3F